MVADIGKTHSKLTLWSGQGALLDRQVRANEPVEIEGIRRLDTEGIGQWLLASLARYRDERVEAIVPVAHGAGVVVLADEELAFAPLDYEQAIPDAVMRSHLTDRDPFAITGSPALPAGLNIGSQLSWLERLYPEIMPRAVLLPWAQYWAWFLTGRPASEVTSLGCHSDLWFPAEARFSPMAERMGWARRFAPVARAADAIGYLRPTIAAATGLPDNVEVLAGLHDSNAALLAARGFVELAGQEATVLSTGTWFIAMRTPGADAPAPDLCEARDCLVNVDIDRRPVPSARFMGGREIELACDGAVDAPEDQPALLAAVPAVIADQAMLLPTLTAGCGPFPDHPGRWLHAPSRPDSRKAAACLYAAFVAETSLDLIGARETLLIEGRFASAEVFVRAIAALRPDLQVFTSTGDVDVSFGALRLVHPELAPPGDLVSVAPLGLDISAHRTRWRDGIRHQARF